MIPHSIRVSSGLKGQGKTDTKHNEKPQDLDYCGFFRIFAERKNIILWHLHTKIR